MKLNSNHTQILVLLLLVVGIISIQQTVTAQVFNTTVLKTHQFQMDKSQGFFNEYGGRYNDGYGGVSPLEGPFYHHLVPSSIPYQGHDKIICLPSLGPCNNASNLASSGYVIEYNMTN